MWKHPQMQLIAPHRDFFTANIIYITLTEQQYKAFIT